MSKFFTVNTTGEAYLRNGASKVTGLEFRLGKPSASIRAINSQGNLTSGWIECQAEDLVRLCREIVAWWDSPLRLGDGKE